MAYFGDAGNLVLKGKLTYGLSSISAGTDDFIVKNGSGTIVALIDTLTGHMKIKGTVYENQASLSTDGSTDFSYNNSSGAVVCLITDTGDVKLTGGLYEQCNP